MNLIRAVRVSRAPMAGLAIVGIFWGGFAALVPDIKTIAGASDAQFGLAMMMSALGSIVAMYFAPVYVRTIKRYSLPVAGLALLIAYHLPIIATDLTRLAVVLLFVGAAIGLLDIASNLRVSVIEAEHTASLMNVNHAMFSFAFGGAAILTGLARQIGMGPAEILPGLAGIGALFLILTFERPASWQADAEASPTIEKGDGVGRVIWLTAIILFCGFIGENATEAWSALHIERTLGAQIGHGSFGPGVLGIVMGVGRLFGQSIADRIGEKALIIASACIGSAGAMLIALAWAPNVVIAGVAIVAVGMAVVVPSVNTVLGRRVAPEQRAHALSRAWMVGMSGYFIGPAMMGLIAEGFGLRVAYVVIACVVAVIIPAIVLLGKIPKVVHVRAKASP